MDIDELNAEVSRMPGMLLGARHFNGDLVTPALRHSKIPADITFHDVICSGKPHRLGWADGTWWRCAGGVWFRVTVEEFYEAGWRVKE